MQRREGEEEKGPPRVPSGLLLYSRLCSMLYCTKRAPSYTNAFSTNGRGGRGGGEPPPSLFNCHLVWGDGAGGEGEGGERGKQGESERRI